MSALAVIIVFTIESNGCEVLFKTGYLIHSPILNNI